MKHSKISTKKLVFTSLFVALTAVCAMIQVPIGAVPISLATLAAMLAGLVLGPWLGLMAEACYVLLGAVGVPIFAGFRGGLSVLAGPTGGYLAGYLLIALLSGFGRKKNAYLAVTAIVAGNLLCYFLGTAWFVVSAKTTVSAALSVCVLPFIPGDITKIALAYLLFLKLKKPLAEVGLIGESNADFKQQEIADAKLK